MIYRFFKSTHTITTIISFMLVVLSAQTSDFNVIELGQNEPSMVGVMLKVALLFILPEVFYRALDFYKNKFLKEER